MKLLYSIIFLLLTFCISATSYAEQVCFSQQEAIDIITLLDSSERDLRSLEDCRILVKELSAEVEHRGVKIKSLTDDIIKANQQVVEYKTKYDQAKKIAWYSGITSVVVIAVAVAQAVL